MLRKIVLSAMMVLAVPTVGMAQREEHREREEHPSRGKPVPGEFRGPHPGGPQGPGEFRGPRPGGPRGPEEFRETRPGGPQGPGEFRGPRLGGPQEPGEFREPRLGGPPGRFVYHGHPFNPVHIAPFVYPRGWAYRRWVIGAVVPPVFLASAYYYSDWAALGLPPPEPGFQWVRYGPDLLLVDVTTGEVVDVVYGAFY